MVAQALVFLGIIFNATGTLSYLIDTVKGKIKPNKVTFFVWSIAPIIAFFAQISQHVGVQSLMTLSVGIFPFSIFLASFVNKKSDWKLRTQDVVCGVLSLVGLFFWYVTKEGNVAIVFSIVSEGLATLPTVIKAYYYPETESALPWLASTIGGLLTLVSITSWDFAHYAFPLFYTFEMFVIFFFSQFKVGKR